MEKKEKILIIGPSQTSEESRKGISSVVANTISSSLMNKFEIIQLNTMKDRQTHGFSLYNLFFAASFSFKALALLMKQKPDIVHIHSSGSWSFYMHSIFLLLAKIFQKKTIFHIHDGTFDSFYEGWVAKRLVKKLLRMSDVLIALTPSWANYFREYIGVPNTEVIPNFIPDNMGIRIDEISRKKQNGKRIVLFVGEIVKYRIVKGIDTVLLAIPIVSAACEDVSFLFAGECNTGRYEMLCNELGIGSHVKFLGEVPFKKMQYLYRSADVFILPSRAEGLPLAVMEAMSYGLPVVTSSIRGTRDLVEDEVNGLIIRPGDHESLARGIIELLEDEPLRYRMGEMNINKIKEEYSEELVVDKLTQLYLSLYGKSSVLSLSQGYD